MYMNFSKFYNVLFTKFYRIQLPAVDIRNKMEKPGEPGTARHGNFINYYSFNPPDRRTSVLDIDKLSSYMNGNDSNTSLALDIGCNAGVSIGLCITQYHSEEKK